MKLITYYQTGKIDVFDTATFTATMKRDQLRNDQVSEQDD